MKIYSNKTSCRVSTWLQPSLLAVLPVLVFYAGVLLRNTNGSFSSFAIDPEFSYLYSGILLSQGKLNLFIDHPGTPLVVLAAVVSRIVHLFRPQGSFVEDVLQNPDVYLGAINIAMIVLIAVTLFLTGLWVYRKTGNLPAVLFLQASPFVVEAVFTSVERYMPEPFFIAVVLLLANVMMLDIYKTNHNGALLRKTYLLYGIIIGFGISLKITFGPFILVPFFMLIGFRNKLWYLLTTLAAFLVFTFPLLKRGEVFYEWIRSILVHSGKYGSGQANIVDPTLFMANLKSIIQSEIHLVYAIILATVVLIIALLPFYRRRAKNRKYIPALIGVTLALVIGILAISKHFAFYYLIPYSLLTFFVFYLSVNVVLEAVGFRRKWLEFLIYSVIVLVMVSRAESMPRFREFFLARKQKFDTRQMITRDVNAMNLQGALVLSADSWHIKPESGLFFGLMMTPGGGRRHFGQMLTDTYPDTYLFKENDKQFFNWFNQPATAKELLGRHPVIHASIKHYSKEVYEMLETLFSETGDADVEVIYQEPVTGLKVYRITRKQSEEFDPAGHSW